MKETDFKQFARQLALWADLVIEHGRTPFRRVDQFPLLYTSKGFFRPPLVFWINRQSLMAGGIILLPDNNLPEQLELGSATATALGLRHFVTWESSRICIWKTDGETCGMEKQLPVTAGDQPETFRALLLEVMEEIKLLSVLGMVPANQLSASYLHNLFQETLNSARAPLVNTFRQTRADGQLQEIISRADRQAEQFNRLTLLRLLALLWHDLLPESILPEKLQTVMQLVLPSLPPQLHQPLSQNLQEQEPVLPLESAVCYHHLLLRLRQINWNSPVERARQAISQFLSAEGMPPERPFQPPDTEVPLLQINPKVPLLGYNLLHELSGSASFMASAALLRHVNNAPPAHQYCGTLFRFSDLPLTIMCIQGQITNRRKVPREVRQRCDALLRTSWPTRRFDLPPDSPYWILETVHLLGLTPKGAELELEIPSVWLIAPYGQTLWTLVGENFQLNRVTWEKQTTILTLKKQRGGAEITKVMYRQTERQIDWSETSCRTRALLLFGLLLPDVIYQQLRSDRFQTCDEIPTSAATDLGLLAYSRTFLGRRLWKLLSGSEPADTAGEIRQQAEMLGWPVPEEDILCQLGLSTAGEHQPERLQQELDRTLSERLKIPAVVDFPIPQWQETHAGSTMRQMASSNHRQKIVDILKARGLPDFPEQYLYQLESPQLIRYAFQPPLKVTSELLGQYELTDSAQACFTVQGEATVEALNLCANLDRCEVDLPADQQQLSSIVTSYRNDLLKLRQELTRQAHILLENPQAAERLSKKIWHELKLPAWKWLDH
ncbi:MAG: hypothetical protein RQ754_06170 [Desulfuromonadales bacterium]|nr:hypothetical protein [Desulfuromonadales bacterium]